MMVMVAIAVVVFDIAMVVISAEVSVRAIASPPFAV